MQTGRCFELNTIGAEVWTLLAAPAPLGQVSGAIASRYDQDPGTVARDVERLVEDLLREKLVEHVTAPAGPAAR